MRVCMCVYVCMFVGMYVCMYKKSVCGNDRLRKNKLVVQQLAFGPWRGSRSKLNNGTRNQPTNQYCTCNQSINRSINKSIIQLFNYSNSFGLTQQRGLEKQQQRLALKLYKPKQIECVQFEALGIKTVQTQAN